MVSHPGPSAAGGSRFPHRRWDRDFARRLAVLDALMLLIAVTVARVVWFGTESAEVASRVRSAPDYWAAAVALALVWWIVLGMYATRIAAVVGIGVTEYQRVIEASVMVFALVSIVALVFAASLSRGFLLAAFPLGIVLLLIGRWGARRWLITRRRVIGDYSTRVLLVGGPTSVGHLYAELVRRKHAGYTPVGVCLARDSGTIDIAVPVIGSDDDVVAAARAAQADMVMVAGHGPAGAEFVRRVGWQLEHSDIELVVATSFTDIVGQRIHVRPVAGLPLIHVQVPRYEGGRLVVKTVFDFLVAVVTLILLSPLMLLAALAVVTTSRGPALYRQVRVGRDGAEFEVFKFRSMRVGADREVRDLAAANEAAGPLFKMRHDPRVTRVGRILRRTSIDELPQIFNVLRGEMSIVGPRPPLPQEVERYEPDVHRRFLVKPGITGPWQISGRSDLSWDESVRLDLFYVENWSLVTDIVYCIRTVAAVVRGRGAY